MLHQTRQLNQIPQPEELLAVYEARCLGETYEDQWEALSRTLIRADVAEEVGLSMTNQDEFDPVDIVREIRNLAHQAQVTTAAADAPPREFEADLFFITLEGSLSNLDGGLFERAIGVMTLGMYEAEMVRAGSSVLILPRLLEPAELSRLSAGKIGRLTRALGTLAAEAACASPEAGSAATSLHELLVELGLHHCGPQRPLSDETHAHRILVGVRVVPKDKSTSDFFRYFDASAGSDPANTYWNGSLGTYLEITDHKLDMIGIRGITPREVCELDYALACTASAMISSTLDAQGEICELPARDEARMVEIHFNRDPEQDQVRISLVYSPSMVAEDVTYGPCTLPLSMITYCCDDLFDVLMTDIAVDVVEHGDPDDLPRASIAEYHTIH